MLTSVLTTTAVLVALSNGASHDVDVGRTGLNFYPSVLSDVATGDVVNFHFYPLNHSVAESTFEQPCQPKSENTIFSGFVPVVDGVASMMWSMTINTTDPIWLYCAQGEHQHCRNGQSMVINPPNDSDRTLDAYMSSAQTADVSSPAEVFGGVLLTNDGGQANGGSRASPITSLVPSSTAGGTATTSIKGTVTVTARPTSTNGVGTVTANLRGKLVLLGLLVAGFLLRW